jgi:hypothetical protein
MHAIDRPAEMILKQGIKSAFSGVRYGFMSCSILDRILFMLLWFESDDIGRTNNETYYFIDLLLTCFAILSTQCLLPNNGRTAC